MKILLAAALAALPAICALPAVAAGEEPVVVLHSRHLAAADEARAQADLWKRWAEDYSREMRASMHATFAGRALSHKVVKGLPYSAEVVTETSQPLADGNVISRRTTGAIHRDGEGRVRQETAGDGRSASVFIHDPVEGKRYVVTQGGRRAVSLPADGTREDRAVRVQVIRSGEGREITLVAPPAPPAPPQPPAPPHGSGFVPPPVPPLPPAPPLPGVETLRFESTARLGPGVTTSLGTREFHGVKAEGKSTVWTIAAGEVGNRNPITVTSETWFSPELQVTVYSRHHDPRTGESIYRLAGIQRGEPPAELFRPPADAKGRERAERK